MAGVRPLDQLGTSPYRTLTEPCFAASLPARVTCGGIRARHDSLLGLPDQPVAATTPPVAAESSTTETCVLRRFTGRDSTGERAAPTYFHVAWRKRAGPMTCLPVPAKEAGLEFETIP
jgi:hypothetical protein